MVLLGALDVAVTVGFAFTVTVTLAVLVHPCAVCPCTLYVVVTVGLAVGLHELEGVSPVVGFQVQPDKATVLFRVSATDWPLHIAGLTGVIFKDGVGFTVIVIVAEEEQFPAVPVTV
jgi:hypothetical protein